MLAARSPCSVNFQRRQFEFLQEAQLSGSTTWDAAKRAEDSHCFEHFLKTFFDWDDAGAKVDQLQFVYGLQKH